MKKGYKYSLFYILMQVNEPTLQINSRLTFFMLLSRYYIYGNTIFVYINHIILNK